MMLSSDLKKNIKTILWENIEITNENLFKF